MKFLIVCVTNEKTVDGSGFCLQALMSHENDRKLIFLMEQVLEEKEEEKSRKKLKYRHLMTRATTGGDQCVVSWNFHES